MGKQCRGNAELLQSRGRGNGEEEQAETREGDL